jgi:hypothetical protein
MLLILAAFGFAVLKVKAKGHRDQATVVGSLPSVSAGEWLTAEGKWVQDREFGQQFRAEMLNSTAPNPRIGRGRGGMIGCARLGEYSQNWVGVFHQATSRSDDVRLEHRVQQSANQLFSHVCNAF